jgi:hypothetical protein
MRFPTICPICFTLSDWHSFFRCGCLTLVNEADQIMRGMNVLSQGRFRTQTIKRLRILTDSSVTIQEEPAASQAGHFELGVALAKCPNPTLVFARFNLSAQRLEVRFAINHPFGSARTHIVFQFVIATFFEHRCNCIVV